LNVITLGTVYMVTTGLAYQWTAYVNTLLETELKLNRELLH